MSATNVRRGRAGTRGSQRRADDHEAACRRRPRSRTARARRARYAAASWMQPLAPRHPRASQRRRLAHQRRQLLLGLADEEGVDERRQRLGVRRRRAAGDDQRRVVAAIGARAAGCPPRSSRLRTFVYVSSYCSEKPTTSNAGSGDADSSVSIGSPRGAQLGLAVQPGRERPLAGDVGGLVQDAVEDLRPQVGHPDLVDVGERQADARRHASPDPCGPAWYSPPTIAGTASRPCSENRRTDAAWHAAAMQASAVSRELATRFPGKRRRTRCRIPRTPAGTPSASTTSRMQGSTELNWAGPSTPTCFTRPEIPIDSFTVTLPWVRLLSRSSAR